MPASGYCATSADRICGAKDTSIIFTPLGVRLGFSIASGVNSSARSPWRRTITIWWGISARRFGPAVECVAAFVTADGSEGAGEVTATAALLSRASRAGGAPALVLLPLAIAAASVLMLPPVNDGSGPPKAPRPAALASLCPAAASAPTSPDEWWLVVLVLLL